MLKDLKVSELRNIADEFGVDRSGAKTKAEILVRLEEEGVTDETVNSFSDIVEDIPPATLKQPSGPQIVVRMDRENPTYEILGHKFTREHPFVVMSEDEAQEVFDHDPRGFRQATPKEAKEYYS